MEECLDIYKLYDPQFRGMLSATRLDFSDPELKDEPVTFIKYDTPLRRRLNMISTSLKNILGLAIEKIIELLNEHPDDKIFVAFNSVSGCFNLAEHLVKIEAIKQDDIAILCSQASKEKIKPYFKDLIDELLPSKLNFLTSAYFTGFDINESYHLISVSSNRNKIFALSDRRLKQIAGRCRKKLLSETVIHDIAPINSDKTENSKETLIKAAESQVQALNCFNRHYQRIPLLKEIHDEIRNRIISTLEEKNANFIRKDIQGSNVISYLNIDAFLEMQRIRIELYQKFNSLYEKLVSDGNDVSREYKVSDTKVEDEQIDKKDRNERVKRIIQVLRKYKSAKRFPFDFAKLDNLEKKIVKEFQVFRTAIDPDCLLNKMEKTLVDKKMQKRLII